MCNYDDAVYKKSKKQIDNPNYYDNYNGNCDNHFWEDLPVGPLIEIAKRLNNFEDFEAFLLVCKCWYFALRESKCKFLGGGDSYSHQRQVPWLLLAEHQVVQTAENDETTYLKSCNDSNSNSNSNSRSKGKEELIRIFFYILSSQRIREWIIRLPPEFREEDLKNCLFLSSHGWLLIVGKGLSAMALFSPFCSSPHNYIPLPGQLSGRVQKFALSASPFFQGDGYAVVIVYDWIKLAVWCPGDDDWTCVHSFWGYPFDGLLDLTFYRGHFYVINMYGRIFRFSPLEKERGDDDSKRIIAQGVTVLGHSDKDPSCSRSYLFMAYMVVHEDKLLVVVRDPLYPEKRPFFVYRRDYGTSGFRVLEIVFPSERQGLDIKEVDSLGNTSLFLGYNHSFSIEIPYEEANNTSPNDSQVSKGPCYYGCKPNCIYFTDDCWPQYTFAQSGGGKDMGIYNMADGSVEQHFQGQSLSDISPPIWVEPCI